MKRRLILGAFVVLMLMCVCALGGCSGKKTINLADYVSVGYSGYSGDGTAYVEIDSNAMLPLLGDNVSAKAIAESFEAGEIKNDGKLSNGDTITVTVNYNTLLMDNAKINVQNPTLTFTVSGLKEKQKLDVFKGVEFGAEGVSPECTVNVIYNDGSPYGTLEMQLENGEIIKSGFSNCNFKNGEKVILRVSDEALEKLRKEYIIEETSREYVVEVDSSYILAAADLTSEARQQLDKIAEDFLDEKIEAVTEYTDKDARLRLLSNVSGVGLGTLYAGVKSSVRELSATGLGGAYIGVGSVSGSWGATVDNQKSIYYIYDADFSYLLKVSPLTTIEDETTCALIVRIDDPKITPEGVMYSKITFASAKDFESAYNSYITSSFEKLP